MSRVLMKGNEAFAEAAEKENIPVFPIGMYMRDSYLDKQV